jgi:hypothetical protein
MRPLVAIASLLLIVTTAGAQDVPTRFDVIHNNELYVQDTPQNALKAAIVALSRDRYDYFLAHLLDPSYVDARLATTQAYFERVASDQLGATAAGQALNPVDFQRRVVEVATRANVRQLGEQIRQKFEDEPDNLRDLKRFSREGQFQDAGETSTASIKDIKDRALYFKKVNGRWFLENKKEDKPAAKE